MERKVTKIGNSICITLPPELLRQVGLSQGDDVQIEVKDGKIILRKKEQAGVKDPALLDSALNRPKQSAFGQDAYPTIYEKAAALFESIAKNHTFHNANKRTALASLIIFLKMNHYRWTMGIDEEQDFTVDVVNHKYTFQDIVSTIKEYTEKL